MPEHDETAVVSALPESNRARNILVRLLDEGTDVWRPIQAEHIAGMVFRLSCELDPIRIEEHWQFVPGGEVECEARVGSDGNAHLFAVRRAELGSNR